MGTSGRSELRAKINSAEIAFGKFLADIPRLRQEKALREAHEAEVRRQKQEAKQRQTQTIAGLQSMTPAQFEYAVGSLWAARGWKVFCTPSSGDRGIDLVFAKGRKKVAVQCKRYKKIVGEGLVREFYGSYTGEFASGIFVTSSTFSDSCKEWAARRKGLFLVDGEKLADLMIENKPKLIVNFEIWKIQRR